VLPHPAIIPMGCDSEIAKTMPSGWCQPVPCGSQCCPGAARGVPTKSSGTDRRGPPEPFCPGRRL